MTKIPDRIDSKFRYVLLSAARAEQLIQSGRPRAEESTNKVTTTAMDEISGDQVAWDYGPAPEPEPEADDLGGEDSEKET